MESKMVIMLVEDDELLAREIGTFLARWGYEVDTVQDFEEILGAFIKIQPQLVLMDINLPYYDGIYWCSQLRRVSQVPVIYISSRSDDRDKIMAISQGGDDYVEKPFRLELLKAKIEAVLRRTYQYKVETQAYITKEIGFDPQRGTVLFESKEIDLTKSEQKILAKLHEEKSKIVTREELMMVLWSTDEFVSDGTLTTVISRLRRKLKEFCGQEVILTRKGQGYLLP